MPDFKSTFFAGRRFLKTFSVLLFFIFGFSFSANSQSLKRVIIKGGDLNSLHTVIKLNKGQLIRQMKNDKALVANIPFSSFKSLKLQPGITVVPDLVFSLSPVSPSGKPDKPGKPGGGDGGGSGPEPQVVTWGNKRIHSDLANPFAKGQGVTVCVIDSGVDKSHEDLSSNIIGGRNFVVKKGRINPSDFNDDNGHGSHVSGTIAAIDNHVGLVGVAPEAKIFAVKALDKRGSGYFSDITDGVYECIDAGAKVINMSLGASGDPEDSYFAPLKSAIQSAVDSGVTVVVAAGNEGQDISATVPAGFSNVIAVSATDSNDNFPSWSNFGLGLKDFAAPGVSIFSTWKSGGYSTIQGTSMASPHVAGVVALMFSAGKSVLGAEDIGASLSRQGKGLIDALDSVQ